MPDSYGKLTVHLHNHRLIYILLLLIVLFSIPILAELISEWYHNDNYSHGYLIIPISLWLFYRKRNELEFPARTYQPGLLLLMVGCLGLIFGIAASEYFTSRLSLVLIITGLALYYLGMRNFRKVWFAFFFLLFMIPIPSIIYYSATAPLQLFASKVTTWFLQTIGVPVARQGNIIALPDYRMEVAEACSGLRSLVSLMALCTLYGYLRMPGKVIPVIMFLGTFPIAIATNVLRVVVTALAAYVFSIALAESFLHEISGLLVFLAALIMVIILGAVLQWIKKRLA